MCARQPGVAATRRRPVAGRCEAGPTDSGLVSDAMSATVSGRALDATVRTVSGGPGS